MTNQRSGESITDMLSEAAIQQYEQDGVAVLRNVISSDWRERLAEPMPDIKATRDNYENVGWELEPGDALLFHRLRVHCAGGNLRPDVRRRGYAIRHTGDDVVYDTQLDTNEANSSETHAHMDILDSDQFPIAWRASRSTSKENFYSEDYQFTL